MRVAFKKNIKLYRVDGCNLSDDCLGLVLEFSMTRVLSVEQELQNNNFFNANCHHD